MDFKHPIIDGAKGHHLRVCCLPGSIHSPSCSWFWTEAPPIKQPNGSNALQPRLKMSGSTEHLPRTRMSSSPSLLRAFFPLNKILISFCISRTDSVAAQKQQMERERNQRCWETAFLLVPPGEGKHTAPCMEAALPGSGHGSSSGLDYPAQPGTKQAGAWSGLTWAPLGNHICPRQPLPHHLPYIHQHRKRLEKVKHTHIHHIYNGWLCYPLPRCSRLWAGLVFRSFN